MKKQQNKLIPTIPFTIEELNKLLNNTADKNLQSKLVDFSRTSNYEFLSNLTIDSIKKPLPGTRLTKKEMKLFNEYVKFKSSLQSQIFQVVQELIDTYHHNLGVINRIEDTTEDFDESELIEEDRNIPQIDTHNAFSSRHKPNLPGVA